MSTKIPLRLTPSGLNHQFLGEGLSFPSYIAKTREIMESTHTTLHAEKTIAANLPFEWFPNPARAIINKDGKYKYGILLIHGLLDSPFAMRELGQHFLDLGFIVRSILLPGHGTRPGDLLDISYQSWLDASRYGIESFKNQVENLYLAGVSAGAALSLYHAFDDQFIKALILISPLIKLRTKYSFIAKWMKKLGGLYTRANWFRIIEDHDYVKYESFPYNLPYQASLLVKQLEKKAQQKKLDIPIFMALSLHDETICSDAAQHFFKQQQHPLNKLILYNEHRLEHPDPHLEYRTSYFPEQKIRGFSHVCLHISPENPHYGKNGDYMHRIYSHKKMTTVEEQSIMHGALHPDNLQKYPMRRLTYNPDYYNLLEIMNNFLLKIA